MPDIRNWPVIGIALIILIAVITLQGVGQAEMSHIKTYTFPNGFKVFIQENPHQDVATIQYWVEVGSADESKEVRGISHVIEHMAFKGTEKRGVGEISKEIDAIGGSVNAYTSWDKTVFHVTVPADKTFQGLDVISDAVLNPVIDPKELEKEKEVVIEEILEGEERPSRKSFYQLFETAYTTSSYKYPVIGFRETVRGITRRDIMDFRKRFYIPRNMFLVVAGNVDAEELRKKVEQYVGDLPRADFIRAPRPEEPEQKQIRSALVRDPNSREARLKIAFHIPSARGVDVSAIDLAADLLGARESSRLVRVLKKEKRLVNSISVYAATPKQPGLFVVSAGLEGENIKAATKEIMEQIKALAGTPPSREELERAKINIESDLLYARETVQGAARSIGDFQVLLDDATYQDKYLMMNRSVTPEQISQVTAKYLSPPNLTISILMPEDEAPDLKLASLVETAKSYQVKSSAEKELEENENVIKTELENGLRVALKPDPTNAIVSFRIALLGGKRFESPESKGIMYFISQMMEKGAGNMSEREIAEAVENLGGRLSAFSEYDTFGLSATFFSRNIEAGLELLSTIYSAPTFPNDKIERERNLIVNKIQNAPDQPARFAIQKLNRALYPTHPYGYPIEGVIGTVSAFTRDDLVSAYKRYAVPSNTVLTAVGDLDPERTLEMIRKYFGKIPSTSFQAPDIPDEKEITEPVENVVRIPRAKAHLAIGFRGPTIEEDDRYALTVLDEALSGMGGRLFIELRDKKSLAYSVASFFRPGLDPGAFIVYMACDPAKVEESVKGIFEQLFLVREKDLSSAEIDRAKHSIIGARDISSQSSWSKAKRNARYELFGLGLDYDEQFRRKILSVTADDIRRVANKYLDPSKYAITKILPEEA